MAAALAGASAKLKINSWSRRAESAMCPACCSKRSKNCSWRGMSRNMGLSALGEAGLSLRAAPGPPHLDADGEDGQHDDDRDHHVDVAVDVRDSGPQQVTRPGEARHPA